MTERSGPHTTSLSLIARSIAKNHGFAIIKMYLASVYVDMEIV